MPTAVSSGMRPVTLSRPASSESSSFHTSSVWYSLLLRPLSPGHPIACSTWDNAGAQSLGICEARKLCRASDHALSRDKSIGHRYKTSPLLALLMMSANETAGSRNARNAASKRARLVNSSSAPCTKGDRRSRPTISMGSASGLVPTKRNAATMIGYSLTGSPREMLKSCCGSRSGRRRLRGWKASANTRSIWLRHRPRSGNDDTDPELRGGRVRGTFPACGAPIRQQHGFRGCDRPGLGGRPRWWNREECAPGL